MLRPPYSSENDAKVPRWPCKTTLQPDLTPSKGIYFAASPHRHGEAGGKPEARDETCYDMLEHQNEHFVRDILQF